MKTTLHRNKTILPLALFLATACGGTGAQEIALPEGTAVWGGRVKDGSLMPYETGFEADLADNRSNQVAPLLLTSGGEYIWSDEPFSFRRTAGGIVILDSSAPVQRVKAGETLADAYRAAARAHFPADGATPPEAFWHQPQYNTWIELMYDQNQEGVLAYARGILEHGLPPGIIMIDDTWQEDYGKWNFHPGRFPDPGAMCDQLHAMGFKVMLWVCPFVSMDQYLVCREAGEGFLKDKDGAPLPVRWWNGTSAVLDLGLPAAQEWFRAQLTRLQTEYGVDGFKFDAGDFEHYPEGERAGWEQCGLYVDLALDYPYNELRSGWRHAGRPVVQRLHDKAHSWEDLRKLIPEMMAESLDGFSFCCPDMVGGGSFETFLKGETDPEIIVRSAQVHALMPMMQFSLAPWRVLDAPAYAAVLKAVGLRERMMPLLDRLYRRAADEGEPIVAPLEFYFPHQGLEKVADEFMLGDSLLVAPVVGPGTQRTVVLPEGSWLADDGSAYAGGTYTLQVPLDRLPCFRRQ